MDELFPYRNPPFSFPYAGLFSPLRNFHDNQFAITGPDSSDAGAGSKKHEESKKRREKKRMSQILCSDNKRQRLHERLRQKLENRKNQDEKLEIKQDNHALSEADLVTLFDSEDSKPKKRKRKKRKNRKKKKKSEKKETKLDACIEQTSNEQNEESTTILAASETIAGEATPREALNESLDSVISDLSTSMDDLLSESTGSIKTPVASLEKLPALTETDADHTLREKGEDALEAGEISDVKDNEENEFDAFTAGESPKENEHLSCGESSTSEPERLSTTSEQDHDETVHQEARCDASCGETVSNDGLEADSIVFTDRDVDAAEEERSTISPEERGNLTEMLIDDEFPWHLYHTEEDSSLSTSFSPIDDAGFTVVRRKEKRPRKRKPSPLRKKKRRGQKRQSRRLKEKKKESPRKKSTPLKHSPRNACPIRTVTIKHETKPEPPPMNKPDPTVQTPTQPPPGFSPINATNTMTIPTGVPSLTKPFEQMQAVNAMFMRMPTEAIITIPFMPMDAVVDGCDFFPMNLDLSYPLDCSIPYYVLPNETAPIEYVPSPI